MHRLSSEWTSTEEIYSSTPVSDLDLTVGETKGVASDSQISKFEHSNTMESSLGTPGDASEPLVSA